jgi:hypothetical protein
MYFLMAGRLEPLRSLRVTIAFITISLVGGWAAGFLGAFGLTALGAAAAGADMLAD